MLIYLLEKWRRLAPLNTFSYTLFPGKCLLCSRSTGRELDLCRSCEMDMPALLECCPGCAIPVADAPTDTPCGDCLEQPPGFDRAISAFQYRYPLSRLIIAWKHEDRFEVWLLIKHLWLAGIVDKVRQHKPDLIIAVPLHPNRQRQRGFDQADDLAVALGSETGIDVQPALRRIRDTGQQTIRGADDRRDALRGAFEVKDEYRDKIATRHIALVDDVHTTGATFEAAAAALYAADAARVTAVSLARTPAQKD